MFALDQTAKAIVVSTLVEDRVVPVLGPVLQWYFVRNAGAAFSFAAGQTWIFTIIACAVLVGVIVFARRIRSTAWAVVFGLVLGGVLGNLFDRLFREPGFGVGHVVDFISTPWLMPAIYNVADMGIVFGMITFVLLTLLDVRLDGTRGRRRERRSTTAVAAADGPAAEAPGERGGSHD